MLGSAFGASFAGAATSSLVQRFAGDALLPRFVVFGSALLLPDWFRICTRMAAGGRLRAEARDRIVLVSGDEEAAALEAELGFSPEKPAALAVRLTLAEARDTGRGEHPLRSEEHTSELPSLMRNSYAVFCLKQKQSYSP